MLRPQLLTTFKQRSVAVTRFASRREYHHSYYKRNQKVDSNTGDQKPQTTFRDLAIVATSFGLFYMIDKCKSLLGFRKLNEKEEIQDCHKNMSNLIVEVEKRVEQPFVGTVTMIPGMELCKKKGDEVLPILCDINAAPSLNFISGPSNCGKSISVETQVTGRKNVIYITLRSNSAKEALAHSLGIEKRRVDEPILPVSELMNVLRHVLIKIKEKRRTDLENNPLPLVILSDYLPNNEDCKVIAGFMLQFVEEQLASSIHVSSNHTTLTELLLLSGHAARLNKYSISYTEQKELNKYAICRDENVQKLGGDMGQIFSFLKKAIPLAQKEHTYGKLMSVDELTSKIVNGDIDIGKENIKSIIDSMIQIEAENIKDTCKKIENKSKTDALNVMVELSKAKTMRPKTSEQVEACELLKERNILTHVLDDTDLYTWHRPILHYAFESTKGYLQEIYLKQ